MIVYTIFYHLIRIFHIIKIFIARFILFIQNKPTAKATATTTAMPNATPMIRPPILLASYLIIDENNDTPNYVSFKPLQIADKMYSINDILKYFNLSADKSVKICGIYKTNHFEKLIHNTQFDTTYIKFSFNDGGSMQIMTDTQEQMTSMKEEFQ